MNIIKPIEEIMKDWALWLKGGKSEHGYGRTFLEKALSGMPTTKCTTCQGSGKVLGERYNLPKLGQVTCLTCGGRGKIIATSSKTQINPAFIRATKFGTPDNPTAERIDVIVNSDLSQIQASVIHQEYLHPRGGNQEQKARRVFVGRTRKRKVKGIHRGYYSRVLNEAHSRILDGLKKNSIAA